MRSGASPACYRASCHAAVSPRCPLAEEIRAGLRCLPNARARTAPDHQRVELLDSAEFTNILNLLHHLMMVYRPYRERNLPCRRRSGLRQTVDNVNLN